MQLAIKVLKGGECQVEVNKHSFKCIKYCIYKFIKKLIDLLCCVQVPDTTTILNLKKEIAKLLHIPVPRQKILYVGRALVDDKPLNSYPTIKNGSKLTVVVKEAEPLKDVMQKIFKKYYSEEQSETLAKEFMVDFERRLDQLSLNDIERMATFFMERDRQIYGEIDSLAT